MKDYIFIDQDIEELRSCLNTSKLPVYRRLVEQNARSASTVLPEVHPQSSTTFIGIAIANFALDWTLSQDKKCLNEARRWINTAVSYPHWGNAHLVDVDLSAAWILFGLGIAFNWLGDDLSVLERTALRDKIVLQARRMYDYKVKTEGSGWSTNYWQNHNWINMTGLAMAGYALEDDVPEARNWINSARENFDFVFSVLPEDGSDYEGVVYWRYGAMWLYIYAHLLKEREGVNYFETSGFLRNSFYYRLYQAAPNLEEQMNFGDAHDRRSGHSTAIYYKTASEYGNGHAQKLGNLVRDDFLMREATLSQVKPGILPECFFEFIFYDADVPEIDFDNLPKTRFFPDLGLFSHRSSWDKDATLFTIKSSSPGGKTQWEWLWKLQKTQGYNCFELSHQHPDNNSFLIHSGGEFIAIDDGYNRNVRAFDHNVVLVDGKGYEGEGVNNVWKNYSPEMFGEVERCEIKQDHWYFVGETASVYRKDLKLNFFRRHVLHTGSGWYFMLDELGSDVSHVYTWQMHSDEHPEVLEDRYRFQLGSAAILDLYQYSDKATSPVLDAHTVRAVMTTQEPDKFTENHMKSLQISNDTPTKNMHFLSVFVPVIEGEGRVDVTSVQTTGAWGIHIQKLDVSETFLFSLDENGMFEDKNITSKITVFRSNKKGAIDVIRY